jgi:hypothetical protein
MYVHGSEQQEISELCVHFTVYGCTVFFFHVLLYTVQTVSAENTCERKATNITCTRNATWMLDTIATCSDLSTA